MSLAARHAAASPLVAASRILPDDVDPLRLLALYPRAPRVSLAQPAAGFALAAVGAAASLVAAGPQRFATLRAHVAATPLPDEGLWLLGYAFADAAPAGAWRGFPAAVLTAPRLMIVRRDGATRLVALAPRADAADALVAATAARLATTDVRAAAPRERRVAPVGSPAAWRRRVAHTVADVAAGRLRKLVLARAVTVDADAPVDPRRLLARLRAAHPDATVFGVGHGAATFVGATPERLVRVAGMRLETAALAGTRPQGGDAAATLLRSRKERAEHAFVVAALHRRLAPLVRRCDAPRVPHVVVAGDVAHLRTPFAATLRAGRGLLDAVAALHPTPAVCGVPHDVARAMLPAREGLARGWYAGGVGWLDAAGDGEVVVPLRCALVRGTRATLFAGAGIVAGSDPDAELEETRLKLRPLLGALLEC